MKPTLTTLACLLGLATINAAHAQTALTQTSQRAGQLLMGPGSRAVSDSSSKDGSETLQQTATVALDSFDRSTGVLVGVAGTLQVDSATTLTVSRPTSSGDYNGTGTLRATWTLPGASIFSGGTGLAQVITDRDAPVGSADTWRALAYAGAAAGWNGFVGASPGAVVQTSVLTTLVASKAKQNGDGSVFATLSDSLTANVGLHYSYLNHARAAFVGGAVDALALVLNGPGAGFNLLALGDEHSTGLDLLGVSCSGDCGQFTLSLSVDDLAAGNLATGLVALTGAPRGGTATYLLTLGDDTAVGATASQLSHTLSLNVSAVPEPASWASMLAGLAAVARLRRRRA